VLHVAHRHQATIARDRDRDALRAIEASFMDESDAAREVRVRLEEYDFEIREAQKRLDSIADKLKEKRAEEEDLRLTKMVRAEQDKKQAASDRNYKEAQRLRDAVAKMKARCTELEQEMEELQTQQKEHSARVEDCLKVSVFLFFLSFPPD
jgi:chromosome segregation ATPase